jgi:hypothetical protein
MGGARKVLSDVNFGERVEVGYNSDVSPPEAMEACGFVDCEGVERRVDSVVNDPILSPRCRLGRGIS